MRSKLRGWMFCCTALVVLAAVAPAWATIYISDAFPTNGTLDGMVPLIGGAWVTHGGTANQLQVIGNQAVVVQSTQSEDSNVPFAGGGSAGPGSVYYAGFDLKVTGAVTVNVYFAHFINPPTTFTTRVWLTGGTSGFYKLAISDSSTMGTSIWASNLAIDTVYRVVISYNYDSKISTLWVNPTAEGDTNIQSAVGAASIGIKGFALREASSSGTTSQYIDNLLVATTFAEVLSGAPPTGACCIVEDCTITTQAACTGTWQGSGSVCTPNPCLIPVGSCCILEPYSCVTGVTQANCAGTWTLNGTCPGTCVEPTGSCCHTDYSCEAPVTHANCTAPSTWTLDGTCPGTCIAPTGACCESGVCSITTRAACTGIYMGDATSCTPNPCLFPPVIINELDSDTPGTDVLEFVELYDGGVGNSSLTGLVVVFYNGSNDLSYAAYDLDGYSTDAQGYFLLGNAAVVPTPSIIFAGNGLQNGADAVALYFGDATQFPTNTPVTTSNLLDAVVYDTADPDDAGLLVLLNPGQPQVDEGTDGTKSIQRCPNGSGGARNTITYVQEAPTPLAANYCPTGACCNLEVCTITMRADCTGTWLGPDTTCSPTNPCLTPVGSCCHSNPWACEENVTQVNCASPAVWTLDGTCTVVCPAPTGACCTGEVCTITTQADCGTGTWKGVDTVCDPNPCLPTGACCVQGSCTIQSKIYCLQTLLGIYLGDGTSCDGGCPTYADVVLNEIRIDQTGTDTDEYFEIAGPPGTSLSGLSFIVIGDASACNPVSNGCRSGAIEAVVDLTGMVIPADGRFLVVEDIFLLRPLSEADLVLSSVLNVLNFENSDNVSHLLVAGFRGTLNDRLDNLPPDGTIDVTPWVSLLDAVSIRGAAGNPPSSDIIEFIYDWGFPGDIIGPDGTNYPGHVYRHIDGPPQADGPGTPWNIGPFNPVGGKDTPGKPNILIGACCQGGECSVQSEPDCLDAGGLYKGAGTTCATPICTGACCIAPADCQLLTKANCTAAGGTYQGDGSDCTNPTLVCYCDSIWAARLLPAGTGVRICGAVLSSKISFIEAATSASFQIQDTSPTGDQSAITVYGLAGVIDPIIASANEGDLIDVQGTTQLYNGLLELVDGVVVGSRPLQLIANNGPGSVPLAVPVTSADFQDHSPTAEGYESEIVQLNCVAFVNIPAPPFHTFHAAVNYVVTDGAGLVTVRISTTNLNLIDTPIPTGVVNIRGIFSQYDSATPFEDFYELTPRSLADIDFAPSNCTAPTGACCVPPPTYCRNGLPADLCYGIGGGWLGAGSVCSDPPEGTPCPDPALVRINEIRIDQPLTDNDEYFELIGTPGTPLGELTYIVIGDGTPTAGSGVIENVTPLTASAIPADGVFLCARSTFTLNPAAVDLVFNLVFENDDNVTHLLVRGFTGTIGQDLDTNDDGVLDLTPWTAIVDEVALVKEVNPPTTTEYYYSTVTVGPDASPELVPFHVYRCLAPPVWRIGMQDPLDLLSRDTPGVANDCLAPGACCTDDVCTITTQTRCSGTWKGADSVCDPNPCGAVLTGACCQLDGTCAETTEALCTGGAIWQGAGTTCTPNLCPTYCATCRGDLNIPADSLRNGRDVQFFVDGMIALGGGPVTQQYACADMNMDGVVDMTDIPLFVNFLTAPGNGACP